MSKLTPRLRARLIFLSRLGLFALLALVACRSTPEAEKELEARLTVVAEGFINPVGLALLPDGSLFVAEEGTGEDDMSAGVSLMAADGQIGRFISGLPSSRDSGDLSGAPLVAVSPDGTTLYLGNFGAGHLWTFPLTPGQSPVLPAEPYTPADLDVAMEPLNNVKLSNPFDITFDSKGTPVVTDATGDGVAKEMPEGTTRFIHRFAPLTNPANDKVTISPVPTGIVRVGSEYYVTLLGGCPYPQGGGQLVAIDESRNQRTVLAGLNMPIDVAQAEDGTIWVLEFATFTPDASCFTGAGYRPNSGRLSRIGEDGSLEPVASGLDFPGAVLPAADGSLYVSEVFGGRILKVTFGPAGETDETVSEIPQLSIAEPSYREIADADEALTAVIERLDLEPNPGKDLREGDTPLARLGQDLFFDPILSGDQNISCATCHHPALAMADGRVLPIGAGGTGLGPGRDFLVQVNLGPEATMDRRQAGETDPQTGITTVTNPFTGRFVPRNSPTVLNAALLPVQFWDGRVESPALGAPVKTLEQAVNALGLTDALAVQALFPLTSMHEMAGATLGDLEPQQIRKVLIARLASEPAYRQQFAAAFNTGEITVAHLAEAIAAFERRFIFTDAPWDAYLKGNPEALSPQQKRGALLFFGELNPSVNCAQCHSGNLFTDLQYYNLLAPQLGPGKGHGSNGREDWGRGRASFDRRDQYTFRTPSLRNVTLTAPYFHSGAYASLEETIWHHANIWQSAANYDPSAHLPPAYYSSVRPFEPGKQGHSVAAPLRAGLPLGEQDVADMAAFLASLTDPAAADLSPFIPDSVPSGLPLDPLPDPADLVRLTGKGPSETAAGPESELVSPFGWQFTDATTEAGLDFQHGVFARDFYEDPVAMMGGGLCWIDFDDDGWLDLYLINSYAEDEVPYWEGQGVLPQNKLFRNNGGRFEDVTESSQADLSMRGNGCAVADFNLDGRPDLYITADGPNALLWNNGDGTFSEGAEAAGVAPSEWNSVAITADLNGDEWPDLFVGSFIDLDKPVPRPVGAFPGDYYGLPDHLYLNNGADESGLVTFRDVAQAAGLAHEERALGAIFSDLDNDGDLDLYIANDGQANRLYENQPWPGGASADAAGIGFRYVERTQEAEVGDTGSGMGITSGDYDGDGLFDLVVTNWEAELNAVYRNETDEEGRINFRYSTYRIGMRGLGNNMTGWGTALADFDHDTDLDLLVVNGRVPVTNWESDPELVRFYGNRLAEGHPGEFREWTPLVGLADVGPLLGRGSGVADYDNDGDLDVVINQIGRPAVLLRNDGGNEAGNWLQVDVGRFLPGTRVTVVLPDGLQMVREGHAGSGYLASEDPRLHFGLGEANVVQELIVRWPDGRQSQLQDVSVNRVLVIRP